MESTSAKLLAHCLEGTHWPEELIDEIVHRPDLQAGFFRDVVEPLSDLFEPRLCDVYAELMAELIGRLLPDDLHAPHLTARYRRVRIPRRFQGDPALIDHVFVLSRVTLGADVAITSVLLDAAKQLFPNAAIHFVGPTKNWELFAADPRLSHVPANYVRAATIGGRLKVWPELREALSRPNSIVIDPDSRLTQLGLLPVCREDEYYFFESRSYATETDEPLSNLAAHWAHATFGISDANAYIATDHATPEFATTVSFGVGDNPDKRLPARIEAEILKLLPRPILVDRGAGGEEAARVECAIKESGVEAQMWDGSFAGFASHIAESGLYLGYDSAGGHVAAACGIPQISIFAGVPCDRFFHRWRPTDAQSARIVRTAPQTDPWPAIREALTSITSI